MGIAERLARLEAARSNDPRMSREEIEIAAAHFEKQIAAMAERNLGSISPDEARAAWRALVERPGSGWMQRVFAGMDPMDLYL